ncbi:MAG: extracellular solute-binding protein, partial [Firmicutes bacterium]|nr:extracellular solute-binding protein [Bacillota bacterium]
MEMSRRSLIKMAGVFGAGLIANYLAGCVPKMGAPSQALTGPSLAGVNLTGAIPREAIKDELAMDGWAFEVGIVQELIRHFSDAYGEKVAYATIPGDYPSVMESMMINRARVDLMYSFPAVAARFYRAGLLHDFESFWDAPAVKAQLSEPVRRAATVDGKLIGLPYFTSVENVVYTNELSLARAGAPSYPETWQELYSKARALKGKGGVDYPLLHKWIPTWFGIAETFVQECLNRNIALFDDQGQPLFDENSEAAGLLEEWRGLVVDKIVPEFVLTMSETDYIDSFARGGYHFSPQQFYDGKVMNDPARSNIAGKSRFLPVTKQPWGILNVAMYLLPRQKEDDANRLSRKYRLAGYLGFQDEKGELAVAKRWAINNALGSGYPALLDDPEVVAA